MTENNNTNNNSKEVADRHKGLLNHFRRCKSGGNEEGNGNVVVGKKNMLVTTTTVTKNKSNEDDHHVHDDDDDDHHDGDGNDDDGDDGVYETWCKLDDPAIVFDDYNDNDIWFTVRFVGFFFSDDILNFIDVSVVIRIFVCLGVCVLPRAIDFYGLYICSHFKTIFLHFNHHDDVHKIESFTLCLSLFPTNICCLLFRRREE